MPRRTFGFDEIGKTGLNRSYGYLFDEFILALRGTRGKKIFREMRDNDSIVGAVVHAISQILREARWDVKTGDGHSLEDETDATLKADAAFLEENMHHMVHPWNTFFSDILTFLTYGFSLFEQVYFRGKDNKIRWRKFAYRSQQSLEKWEFDEVGEVLGFHQRPAPDYHLYFIPITKCLHFKTESAGVNPEGRSILRNSFRPWFFKKSIEEIEAIGIERDLTGLPTLTMPEGVDPNKDDADVQAQIASAKTLISNIRRDEQEGVLLPYGWELNLIASSGTRQIDTVSVINRYNKEIAVTVLAQFVMLGMERTGSYALAKEQTDMFYMSLEGWADTIATTINRGPVRTLFSLNGISNRPLPYVVHTPIRRFTLKDVSEYVAKLAAPELNALEIDADVKRFLKRYARLEEFSEVSR
jgi:hypothetical protein